MSSLDCAMRTGFVCTGVRRIFAAIVAHPAIVTTDTIEAAHSTRVVIVVWLRLVISVTSSRAPRKSGSHVGYRLIRTSAETRPTVGRACLELSDHHGVGPEPGLRGVSRSLAA